MTKKYASGSGGGDSVKNAKDNLFSGDAIEVVLGIAEGPIHGIKGATIAEQLNHVYLDGTAVLSQSGNRNFLDSQIILSYERGTPVTIDQDTEFGQTPIPYILGGNATPINVGATLDYKIPVSRTVPAGYRNQYNKIEIRLLVSRHVHFKKKGTSELSTLIKIRYKPASETTWQVKRQTITGKTVSGGYVSSVELYLSDTSEDYDLEVTMHHVNEPETTARDIAWLAYELSNTLKDRDGNVRRELHPGTAMVSFVAKIGENFSNLPNFTAVWRGLLCSIPSNYDPETRMYDETTPWDGSFKAGKYWTNNPFWLARELILNPRFGMARYNPSVSVDDYSIYEEAKYADTPRTTPDGRTIPLFTFNGLITQPMQGLELINYILGSANAQALEYASGHLRVVSDRNTVSVMTVVPEMCVQLQDDVIFTYSATDIKDRFNEINVSYIEPKMEWQPQFIGPFVDSAAQEVQGVNVYEFEAIGCTEVAECEYKAYFKLVSAQTETVTVTFNIPGYAMDWDIFDIIDLVDPTMDWGLSGRALSVSGTDVLLRDALYFEDAGTYEFHLQTLDNSKVISHFTIESPGSYRTLLLDLPVVEPLAQYPAFSVMREGANPGQAKPFRVVSIKPVDGSPNIFSVTAIEVNRNKWQQALDLQVGEKPYYNFERPRRPDSPTNLRFVSSLVVPKDGRGQNLVALTWDGSEGGFLGLTYTLQVSIDGAAYVDVGSTRLTFFETEVEPNREYAFRVRLNYSDIELYSDILNYEVPNYVAADFDLSRLIFSVEGQYVGENLEFKVTATYKYPDTEQVVNLIGSEKVKGFVLDLFYVEGGLALPLLSKISSEPEVQVLADEQYDLRGMLASEIICEVRLIDYLDNFFPAVGVSASVSVYGLPIVTAITASSTSRTISAEATTNATLKRNQGIRWFISDEPEGVNKKLVAETPSLYAYTVNLPDTDFYLWAQPYSSYGLGVLYPLGNGVMVRTQVLQPFESAEPTLEEIQALLSEQINESYLAQTLRARIDLIDVSNNGGLIAAQQLLATDLQSAKDLLQGQINSQGTMIVQLQQADATQAQQLTALTLRTDDLDSTVLQLDTVSSGHASRLTQIETVNATQANSISSLQFVTGEQAGRLTTLESDNGTNKSKITTLETTTAAHASSIATLEFDSDAMQSQITTLQTVKADSAAVTTQISLAKGEAIAAAEDTARAYTDTKTGEIRAERTIKVEADGRVAGIGLIAGATSGSALYFTADKIAILPPGALSVTGARLPFIYDADTGAIIMDTAFIRDLTASQIAGGVLNLTQGNIRNLTVFESFSPPDQFLEKAHFSDSLARELAWVDPNAVATGGSLSKTLTPALTTTAMGSFLSGGQAPSIKITGSASDDIYATPVGGSITVRLLRNNVPVSVNGQTDHVFQVQSYLVTDEALPPAERRYMLSVIGKVDGVASAVAGNTTTSWSIRIVSTTGDTPNCVIKATVFEAFGSSGGLIANTTWDAISGKPATATRWPTATEAGALPNTGGTLTGQVTYEAGAVQSISERWHVNGTLRWAMGREADGNQFNLWHYNTSGAYVRAFSFNGSTGVFTAANYSGLWGGYGYAATATANSMALRDSSADIRARLFRSEYANQTNIAGAMAFRVSAAGDNYIRFCSDQSAIRTWLDAPSRSGVGASGSWPINISGTAASANLLAYAPSINRTAFNGSANIEVTEWFHSGRDFPTGTLVTTSINYAVSSGDPWVLEVTGNSYSTNESFDLKAQGYIYAGTCINIGGHINGYDMPGIIAMNIGGFLCFWWPRYAYWQGFNVRVYSANSGANQNRVTSMADSADPGGTKRVTISDKLRAKPVPVSMLSQTGGANKVAQYAGSGYLLVDNWVRLANNTGMFYPNGTHINSVGNGDLSIRGSTTATQITLATGVGDIRGYVYATHNNDVGFLNHSGSWAIRCNGTTVTLGTLSASGSITANGVYSGNWFRSIGPTGWFSETYGGGIYMEDTTWVRVYNGKKFLVTNTAADAISCSGGVGGYQLGVKSSSGTGDGISLYGGAVVGAPAYGLMFAQTSNFGTYGPVSGDWATYLTMTGATGRGWVFRHGSTNVASISGAGNAQFAGQLYVEGNYKVMSYKDFEPGMLPPAGLEGAITASWLAAGVVTANIVASGGINVVDGGNSVSIHPKATTPLRFEKDGVETFSVNIDGTGYYAGGLAKDTVDAEAITDEAKKAINQRYLGGGERKTLGTTFLTTGSAGLLPTFTTLVVGDKISITARFSGGDGWDEFNGTADPMWNSASYTLQIQRSINNAAFATVGSTVSLSVPVTVTGGHDGEPVMKSYAYNKSISFTDQLTTTSSNIRYRVLVTRTGGSTTGPGAGLYLMNMAGERSAFNLNEIRGSTGGPRQFIDKDTGWCTITGEVTVPSDSNTYVSFPTALAEVFSSFAQGVFVSYGEYSNGAANATLGGVRVYNQLATRVIKYVVHGRVNI